MGMQIMDFLSADTDNDSHSGSEISNYNNFKFWIIKISSQPVLYADLRIWMTKM